MDAVLSNEVFAGDDDGRKEEEVVVMNRGGTVEKL